MRIDENNPQLNLHEKLCQIMGNKSNSEGMRLLTDDYLVLDGDDTLKKGLDGCPTQDTPLKVRPLFELGFPLQGGLSCWQELTIRKLPELLEQKSACKLLDQAGIVVGLQP